MKKSLFTLFAMAAAATAANAQALDRPFQSLQTLSVNNTATMVAPSAKPLAKSPSNGVWFDRPSGVYYMSGKTSMGYPNDFSYFMVPSFVDLTYPNMSTNKASTTWTVNNQPVEADANGDFTTMYPALEEGYVFWAPQISSGGTKWQAVDNIYVTGNLVSLQSFNLLKAEGPYTGFYNSDEYPFGTYMHSYTDPETGKNYKPVGFYQAFEKPASPLTISSILIPGFCRRQAEPFAPGQEIAISICKVVKEEGRIPQPGDVIQRLTCTYDDLVKQDTQEDFHFYLFRFTKKVQGDYGTVEEPVVIDEEFCCVLGGLDEPGVDIGTAMLDTGSDDIELPKLNCTYSMLVAEDNSDESVIVSRTSVENKAIYNCYWFFEGMFDNVIVESGEGLNKVRVSDDGQTNSTDKTQALEGALVYTSAVWYNPEDQSENYEIITDADWVDYVEVDESKRYANDGTFVAGSMIVKFICQPLPAGTSGRKANVYIKGRGVQSAEAIELLQGDATAGIEGVTVDTEDANAPAYNLAGQKVADNAKGLVIKNGKKFFNK